LRKEFGASPDCFAIGEVRDLVQVERSMFGRRAIFDFACVSLALMSFRSPAKAPAVRLSAVSHAKLCVTEGVIQGLDGERFEVNVPKMRAYLNEYTSPIIEEKFTYLGGTQNESRLGSGEIRQQFGLKLRAQDACNLVYVMWRVEPESKLVVSIKSNPGEHTSEQCGNRGYRNIKPRSSSPVPILYSGNSHTLRAEMNGTELRVTIDTSPVWAGSVGQEALAFDGPVGIRTDNVQLQLELRTPPPADAPPKHIPGCRSANEDSN
jgi:hypothetical protein